MPYAGRARFLHRDVRETDTFTTVQASWDRWTPSSGELPSKPATAAPRATQMPAVAVDPVCGLKVDPRTAPQASHEGHVYHFCSEQHRELFVKDPAKFAPKKTQ